MCHRDHVRRWGSGLGCAWDGTTARILGFWGRILWYLGICYDAIAILDAIQWLYQPPKVRCLQENLDEIMVLLIISWEFLCFFPQILEGKCSMQLVAWLLKHKLLRLGKAQSRPVAEIYMAECSSKSDEYGRDDGGNTYPSLHAMLVCTELSIADACHPLGSTNWIV